MRYFVPDIRVTEEAHNDSGLLAGERLGGSPWGLPAERWPRCSDCGRAQGLLAQFQHHAERLDLGRPGRMLFAFMCGDTTGTCPTWEHDSGANAVFVVEPEDLRSGRTALPDDAPEPDNEVLIVAWSENDDGLPESLAPAFYEDASYFALSQEVIDQVKISTRLGSVPWWVQNPREAPRPGWRFVGQLDSNYCFLTPPVGNYAWVSLDPDRTEGSSHIAYLPHFGSGVAYLFLHASADPPAARMLWQS